MQTANFRDEVMFPLAQKMGADPSVDFPPDLAAAYAVFINAWVRRLYPNFDWPEWTLIEQRTPDASHYVDFAQAGQNVIGRVMKVYLADPSIQDAILDIPFRLNANGIHCRFEHGTNVWIKYIQAAPKYTSTPWSATPTYNKGDLVYDPTRGNVYINTELLNHNHPVTDPAYWALVPFPLELVDLVVRGAYAEALREDGQTDKANSEEQAVMAELALKTAVKTGASYDPMTDQSRPAPRYRLPGLADATAGGG